MDNVLPRYSRPHGADCSWPEDPGGTRPTLPPQRVRALPEVGGGTGHSAEASGWGPHSRRLYRPLVSKAVAGELSQSPEPPPGPLTTTRRPLEGESARIPYAARGPGVGVGAFGDRKGILCPAPWGLGTLPWLRRNPSCAGPASTHTKTAPAARPLPAPPRTPAGPVAGAEQGRGGRARGPGRRAQPPPR